MLKSHLLWCGGFGAGLGCVTSVVVRALPAPESLYAGWITLKATFGVFDDVTKQDDPVGRALKWADEFIRTYPLRAWLVGTLMPAGLAVNHLFVNDLSNRGYLPFALTWFTLMLTIGSAFVGLVIDLYALRAVRSLDPKIRPYALLVSFVLMVGGLLFVRSVF